MRPVGPAIIFHGVALLSAARIAPLSSIIDAHDMPTRRRAGASDRSVGGGAGRRRMARAPRRRDRLGRLPQRPAVTAAVLAQTTSSPST